MFLPGKGLFAFRARKAGDDILLEGVSTRYTAIALIGLATEPEDVAREVLHGQSPGAVCSRLLDAIGQTENLGDVSLILWAARTWRHQGLAQAVDRLIGLDPCGGPHPTVELAWALTAMTVDSPEDRLLSEADHVANRLLESFDERSSLFSHWPARRVASRWRLHVTCFADWVYPVQALAHHYRAIGWRTALEMAEASTRQMCALQGPHGQWWWHYDVRTGQVLERYPVYAVHQDAMAPMAIFALRDAGGTDHGEACYHGLRWLQKPWEVPESLIDSGESLIWRKVARREPAKLVRGMQAWVSRLHAGFRIPACDRLFPPTFVDYECRPYHLGWLLYAWSGDQDRG